MKRSKMKELRIAAATAARRSFVLTVAWADESSDAIDLSAPVAHVRGLAPLRKPGAFQHARVGERGWSVVWPGDIDIGADTLWRMAREQAGEAMPRDAFRNWRARNVLTLEGAAEALGLSRRMIAYYDSGARMIPKTVMLATQGYNPSRRKRAA